MQKVPFFLGALGITAALTLTSPGAGTAPAQQSPSSSAGENRSASPTASRTERDATTPDFRGGKELLSAFYGIQHVRQEGVENQKQLDSLYQKQVDSLASLLASDRLQVLIGTVPDPVGSNLDWAFDSYLGALRRAFEASGFVPDRFWLPWDPDQQDAPSFRRSPEHVLDREARPGVMLFRAKDYLDTRELRLLYLVGELPTSGVHRPAFKAALAERADLLESTADTLEADPLRIIGPVFSGSAMSLRQLLEEALRNKELSGPSDSAVVISGSATVPENAEIFEESHLPIWFRATVNPDPILVRMLAEVVLDPLGIAPEQVALLHESTTQYGQSMNVESESTDVDSEPTGEGSSAADRFLRIPFPMNIASLRAEYERNPDAKPENGKVPNLQAESRIPLSLQNPLRPTESVPVFSRMTAPATDLLLNEIARTLTDHGIRAVGLVATDVRDKLFLAAEIRKRMRDVQLFTYESNVLYLWPEYNAALRGMLVLTSYPLLLRNQRWTSEDRFARLAFSNDWAEGVYNATLVQLHNEAALLDYRSPALDSQQTSVYPPVWLTVVGRRSFLPVSVQGQESGSNSYVHETAASGGGPLVVGTWEHTPLGFSFLVGTILFGFFISVLAFRTGRAAQAERYRRNELSSRTGEGLEQSEQSPSRGAQPTARWVVPFPSYFCQRTRSLRRKWEDVKKERDQRKERAKTSLDQQAWLAGEVRWGSLLIHREIYLALRLCALCGIFLPAFVLIYRAAWQSGTLDPEVFLASILALYRTAWQSATLGPQIVLLSVLVFLALSFLGGVGFGLYHHIRRGWQLFRHFLAPGLAYASGKVPWWQHRWERQLWITEIAARFLVILIGVLYLIGTGVFVGKILFSLEEPASTFFTFRAMQLSSGVSPLLPLIISGILLTAWCSWHLERIKLLKQTTSFEDACIDAVHEKQPSRTGGFVGPSATDVDEVWKRLLMLIPTQTGAYIMGMLVAIGLVLWFFQFKPTLEATLLGSGPLVVNEFDYLLRFGILAALGTTLWAVYRLYLVWRAFQDVLSGLSRTPLLPAFERLPAQISRITRLTFLKPSSVESVSSVIPIQWRHLRSMYNIMNTEADRQQPSEGADQEQAKAVREKELRGFSQLRQKDRELADQITDAMQELEAPKIRGTRCPETDLGKPTQELNAILEKLWEEEPTEVEIGNMVEYLAKPDALESSLLSNTSSRFRRSFADPVRLWLRAAEEFAAVQVVDYIEWVLQHLRRLALFLFLSLLLTTALLSCYPFQPQSLFKLIFFFILIVTVGVLFRVMVQMNRDEVLSRIAKNDPGRITWDLPFLFNAFLLVVVPLLALASSEFPFLRNILFAWVDPLFRVLATGA